MKTANIVANEKKFRTFDNRIQFGSCKPIDKMGKRRLKFFIRLFQLNLKKKKEKKPLKDTLQDWCERIKCTKLER